MRTIYKDATGQEKHEVFYSNILKRHLVQYDYRRTNGDLFSCVADSLEDARKERDNWFKSQDYGKYALTEKRKRRA
jgi:hypothetical protein